MFNELLNWILADVHNALCIGAGIVAVCVFGMLRNALKSANCGRRVY